MSVRLRAIYKDGAFVPVTTGELSGVRENSEVEITLHDPYTLPPTVTDPDVRARLLKELVQDMKDNPIIGDPPRFTREELHERR